MLLNDEAQSNASYDPNSTLKWLTQDVTCQQNNTCKHDGRHPFADDYFQALRSYHSIGEWVAQHPRMMVVFSSDIRQQTKLLGYRLNSWEINEHMTQPTLRQNHCKHRDVYHTSTAAEVAGRRGELDLPPSKPLHIFTNSRKASTLRKGEKNVSSPCAFHNLISTTLTMLNWAAPIGNVHTGPAGTDSCDSRS